MRIKYLGDHAKTCLQTELSIAKLQYLYVDDLVTRQDQHSHGYDILGHDNMSSRLVFGVESLPLGVPVELEVILEVAT